MRYLDITLVERMDNPLPYRWTKQDPKWYRAEFEKDGITYWVHCYPGNWDGEACWIFDFGITEASAKSRGDTRTTGMTGYRNPFSVLSTVKAILDEFIDDHRPKLIIFYDADRVASRSRMYDLYSDYLQSRWGYRSDPDDPLVAKTFRTTGARVWALRK